jgi:peptidoglycan/xylan/chitin deacetylase (PgdA/CDA1 family)
MIPRRPGPAILMYHRVAEESFDPWGMAVSPTHFAEQAEWLARNREVFPLREFAAAHRAGKLPADAVAITFDDGYACTFTTAAPVLDRLGLPAAVFLPAAPLERGGEFWWDELENLVLEFRGSALVLDSQEVKLGPRIGADREWPRYAAPRTPRQKAFRELWSMMRRKSGEEVQVAMADLRRQAERTSVVRDSHRVATAEEVTSSKIEIGCHGLTHASLPQLSASEKIIEIRDGKALLTKLTGREPATFSYPFGDFDAAVRESVAADGFVCACASRHTFVRPDADDFALPRLVVEDGDARALERMLSGR